jgi:hypothetical protein
VGHSKAMDQHRIVIELECCISKKIVSLIAVKSGTKYSLTIVGDTASAIGMFPDNWEKLVEFTNSPANTVLKLATITLSIYHLNGQWKCIKVITDRNEGLHHIKTVIVTVIQTII